MDATCLALEHNLTPDLISLLLQGIAEQLRYCFQNPVDLPVELFLEVSLGYLLEPKVINDGQIHQNAA